MYNVHEMKKLVQNRKVNFGTCHDFESNYVHYQFYEFNILIHGHGIVRYTYFFFINKN